MMKTLIKQSLIAAVLFTSLTSYAYGVEPLVKVAGLENKAFALIMNNLDSEEVQIFIKDENGTVLHREDLTINAGYWKKYDLKALPQGQYTLEIEDESLVKVMPFSVTNNEVMFVQGDERKVFKPYVRLRGNRVDAMFMNMENKSTNVAIYDGEGNILRSEKVAAGQNVERVYDFSNLEEGTYQITFRNDDRLFSKKVTIQK